MLFVLIFCGAGAGRRRRGRDGAGPRPPAQNRARHAAGSLLGSPSPRGRWGRSTAERSQERRLLPSAPALWTSGGPAAPARARGRDRRLRRPDPGARSAALGPHGPGPLPAARTGGSRARKTEPPGGRGPGCPDVSAQELRVGSGVERRAEDGLPASGRWRGEGGRAEGEGEKRKKRKKSFFRGKQRNRK